MIIFSGFDVAQSCLKYCEKVFKAILPLTHCHCQLLDKTLIRYALDAAKPSNLTFPIHHFETVKSCLKYCHKIFDCILPLDHCPCEIITSEDILFALQNLERAKIEQIIREENAVIPKPLKKRERSTFEDSNDDINAETSGKKHRSSRRRGSSNGSSKSKT